MESSIARRLPHDELSTGVNSLAVSVSGAIQMPCDAAWWLSWEDDDVPVAAEEAEMSVERESTTAKRTANASAHLLGFSVFVRRDFEGSAARRRV